MRENVRQQELLQAAVRRRLEALRRRLGDDPLRWPEQAQEQFQFLAPHLRRDDGDAWLRAALPALRRTPAGQFAEYRETLPIGTPYGAPDGALRRKSYGPNWQGDATAVESQDVRSLGPSRTAVRWIGNADRLAALRESDRRRVAEGLAAEHGTEIARLSVSDLAPGAGRYYEVDPQAVLAEEHAQKVAVQRLNEEAKAARDGSNQLGTGVSLQISNLQALVARGGEKLGFYEPGTADAVTEHAALREDAIDQMRGGSEADRFMRGVGKTVMALATAKGAGKALTPARGAYGTALRGAALPAFYGLSTANQSYVEAKLAGKSEQEARDYALSKGSVEVGVTAALTAAGKLLSWRRGVANTELGEAVTRTMVDRAARLGLSFGRELTEENVNALAQAYVDVLHGVDPHALDRDRLVETVWDTTLATLLTQGAFRGSHELSGQLGKVRVRPSIATQMAEPGPASTRATVPAPLSGAAPSQVPAVPTASGAAADAGSAARGATPQSREPPSNDAPASPPAAVSTSSRMKDIRVGERLRLKDGRQAVVESIDGPRLQVTIGDRRVDISRGAVHRREVESAPRDSIGSVANAPSSGSGAKSSGSVPSAMVQRASAPAPSPRTAQAAPASPTATEVDARRLDRPTPGARPTSPPPDALASGGALILENGSRIRFARSEAEELITSGRITAPLKSGERRRTYPLSSVVRVEGPDGKPVWRRVSAEQSPSVSKSAGTNATRRTATSESSGKAVDKASGSAPVRGAATPRSEQPSSARGDAPRSTSDRHARPPDVRTPVDAIETPRPPTGRSMIEAWNARADSQSRFEPPPLSRRYHDGRGRIRTMDDAQFERYSKLTDEITERLIATHNFAEHGVATDGVDGRPPSAADMKRLGELRDTARQAALEVVRGPLDPAGVTPDKKLEKIVRDVRKQSLRIQVGQRSATAGSSSPQAVGEANSKSTPHDLDRALRELRRLNAGATSDGVVLGDARVQPRSLEVGMSPSTGRTASSPDNSSKVQSGQNDSSSRIANESDLSSESAQAENRGVVWVTERSYRSEDADSWDSSLEGAHSDFSSKRRRVPALRFENRNPRGKPYVRFDGVDPKNPKVLIDRKWNVTTKRDQVRKFRSGPLEALKQNPDYRLRIEVPNERAKKAAERLLKRATKRRISTQIEVVIPKETR